MKVRILVVLKTVGYFGVFHPVRRGRGGETSEEIELRAYFLNVPVDSQFATFPLDLPTLS